MVKEISSRSSSLAHSLLNPLLRSLGSTVANAGFVENLGLYKTLIDHLQEAKGEAKTVINMKSIKFSKGTNLAESAIMPYKIIGGTVPLRTSSSRLGR